VQISVTYHPYCASLLLSLGDHKNEGDWIDCLTSSKQYFSHIQDEKNEGAFNLGKKVYQLPNVGGSPVSSTNKTGHHEITEILLKVVLNTI